MAQPFTHSAEALHGFFSQMGRGFYIPYYQRNYSWDDENAKKLITDIFAAVRRTLSKPTHALFLGTVILHDEKNPKLGTHFDTPNLLTKVSNVVDGQQRITSLAILACVFAEYAGRLASQLTTVGGAHAEFASLANELTDEVRLIREFFSVETTKGGAQPSRKPIVIRAGDVTSNPVSDQWTLAGAIDAFYRSNTSSLLANAINGVKLADLALDDRLKSVVEEFIGTIESQLETADQPLASRLLVANDMESSALERFTGYPPDLTKIGALGAPEQKCFYSALLLLAASIYLRKGCHVVVIECLDESLAFDMFQSLNATGTPLTAFEVFKPAVVKAWGANYSTGIKPQVDRIERVFDEESTADRKEDLTDRVIVSTALVYDGTELSKRFSEERDWLTSTLPAPPSALATTFVQALADQAEYFDVVVKPRRSPKNSTNLGLVTHLQQLGMPLDDADLAALCIYFVRDAQHAMAHSVLSLFYAKLLRAKGDPVALAGASAEFLAAAKAVAAFFTLWMGASQGRFPDSDYRKLFDQHVPNMSVKGGSANQTAAYLKDALRLALAGQGIYDATSSSAARSLWVNAAKGSPWYQRKTVCKFGLFVSAHDVGVDLASGREGFYVDGKPGSVPMLTSKAWHASAFEVIEHVATRDRPKKLTFPGMFDPAIYPGNTSIVDKIGNLTLLSMPVNSSVYSEWPDKAFYYWHLTTPTSTAAGPSSGALMASLGIASLPPSLSTLSAGTQHVPHLAPLALRGTAGAKWDASFIEERSQHLCERIFDKLDGWLR